MLGYSELDDLLATTFVKASHAVTVLAEIFSGPPPSPPSNRSHLSIPEYSINDCILHHEIVSKFGDMASN